MVVARAGHISQNLVLTVRSRERVKERRTMKPPIANRATTIAAAVALALVASSFGAQPAAQNSGTDWPSYNRTLTSDRFSPLDQINRSNASRLKQLCVYDLNVDTSFQTGPIVIGRTMYVTTDKEILAMDAETCRPQWRV